MDSSYMTCFKFLPQMANLQPYCWSREAAFNKYVGDELVINALFINALRPFSWVAVGDTWTQMYSYCSVSTRLQRR